MSIFSGSSKELIDVVAQWTSGFGFGFAMRGARIKRNRIPKPPKPICGCGHHWASHDPQTMTCNAKVWDPVYNADGNEVGQSPRACSCKQYSGPQPQPEIYAY